MSDPATAPASEERSPDEPLSELDDSLEQASGGIQVITTDKSGQLRRPTHSWA